MDKCLRAISLSRKQYLGDRTLSQAQNITLLYRPKRKSKWFKFPVLKARDLGSQHKFSSLWDSLRATNEHKRRKRSRKLYSSANCARLRVRSQRWRHARTASTISTWLASRTTTRFPSGTFATSAVLHGTNKCGIRRGGFNMSRKWWPMSYRNWSLRRLRSKRRRRSILSVTANLLCDTHIMCMRTRNLNIRYKINF